MKLYKVTGPSGESIHGGSFRWDLPKDGQPGAWTPEAIPSLCNSGYHLTANIPAWWRPDCRIWEAEGQGASREDETKSVHASARLVREVTDAAELATLRVFVSGAHEITRGKAILLGNSRATLYENSRATLYGNSRATLRENSSAELNGNAVAVSWQMKPNVKVSDKSVHIARGDGTKAPKIHVTKKGKSK